MDAGLGPSMIQSDYAEETARQKAFLDSSQCLDTLQSQLNDNVSQQKLAAHDKGSVVSNFPSSSILSVLKLNSHLHLYLSLPMLRLDKNGLSEQDCKQLPTTSRKPYSSNQDVRTKHVAAISTLMLYLAALCSGGTA